MTEDQNQNDQTTGQPGEGTEPETARDLGARDHGRRPSPCPP